MIFLRWVVDLDGAPACINYPMVCFFEAWMDRNSGNFFFNECALTKCFIHPSNSTLRLAAGIIEAFKGKLLVDLACPINKVRFPSVNINDYQSLFLLYLLVRVPLNSSHGSAWITLTNTHLFSIPFSSFLGQFRHSFITQLLFYQIPESLNFIAFPMALFLFL